MDNSSRLSSVGDESVSMYYSFNSTTVDKTLEAEEECIAVDSSHENQNSTLEADEPLGSHTKTVVKKNLSETTSSPLRAIPKNILQQYQALSSTPTKPSDLRCDLLKRRSVINDLGIAFLEAPQEKIEAIAENKENVPIAVDENAKIIDENHKKGVPKQIERDGKKIRFSVFPTSSEIPIINKKPVTLSLKPRKSIMKPSEPNLNTNKPSRISTYKRPQTIANSEKQAKTAPKKIENEHSPVDIPKMIKKFIKDGSTGPTNMTKKPMPRVSMFVEQKVKIKQTEKPFHLVAKATRMSIVKTTLNSPARRDSFKLHSMKNHSRKSVMQLNARRSAFPVPNGGVNSRQSIMPRTTIPAIQRRSVMPNRKSMAPNVATTDPTKRIRKSLAVEKNSPKVEVKIEPPVISTKSDFVKPRKPSNLKEEFTCTVCSRKFRVLSLFEAHKRSHTTKTTNEIGSNKQCKFCDKKFAIEKALNNHLLSNCPKIPPAEKKKLMYPSKTDTVKSLKSTPVTASSVASSSLSSNDSQSSIANSFRHDDKMLPPSSNKVKRNTAHSGVYRTPTKRIHCYSCKKTFYNILSYTEHCLSHSNSNIAAITNGIANVQIEETDHDAKQHTSADTQTNSAPMVNSETQTLENATN